MQVLLLPMLKPRSYTREDVVELHCHGGSVCVQRVLSLCLVRVRCAHASSLCGLTTSKHAASWSATCVTWRVHHACLHERCARTPRMRSSSLV